MGTDFGISGLNTGMDTSLIIQKLVELNQRPIQVITAKENIEKQKLSSFKDLQNRLQTFNSIVSTLNTKDRFIATKGIFTNANASATSRVVDITTNSQASSGVHSFSVLALAQESKIISEGFSSINSTLDHGRFDIRVGGTLTTINIDSSNNTLEGLRLAINNSGASVKADYINDGSSTAPIKLMIAGTQTGENNAVTASLISSQGFAGDVETMSFTQTQAAQNASMIVNGVNVSKSSNLVTDVIPGSILTLSGIGAGTITLSTDVDNIKQKINNFVNGYNDIMGFLNIQLALGNNNKTGVLFGNAAVVNLQSSLRDAVSETVVGTSGPYSFFSQIGISTQRDGTLQIDEGSLTTALTQNISNVSQLFGSQGTTTNSAVAYVGFTNNTAPGTYDIRVQNGIPQVSVSGMNQFTDAVGSGNFWAGATGTDAEGLNFRIATRVDGSYGSITQTTGIADKIKKEITTQTNQSLNGPLTSEIKSSNVTIADYEKTIRNQSERLTLYQDNLKAKFSNLEVVVGKLKSQGAAFASALGGASGSSTAK